MAFHTTEGYVLVPFRPSLHNLSSPLLPPLPPRTQAISKKILCLGTIPTVVVMGELAVVVMGEAAVVVMGESVVLISIKILEVLMVNGMHD